ncbi:MAG: HEAT repeat domain-containing protein, partial [Planctomycetota bacterium]|nr:HEAT repeat domain-containing protein [Planctomycetota bacterium]
WPTESQHKQLHPATAAALGQLDYESEASASKAVECLARLINYPEAAVRFFVADSLSRLTIVDVRKHLEKLAKDSELRVRSAAVRGLGRCGLRPNTPKDARRQIIGSLIDLYLGTDKDLRPIAQTGLSNLNKDDFDKTLLNLTLTTEVFDKKNKIAAAMPFLEILELEDNVTKDRAPRYHWLLEARVRAALAEASNVSEKRKESLIQSALADARYLEKSPYTKAKARYRRLEAKAHLLLGDGQTVCQLLAKDGKLIESWDLWKTGLKLLQEKKQKSVVQKLLSELNKTGFTPKQLADLKGIERWLGGKAPKVKGPGKKPGGKP